MDKYVVEKKTVVASVDKIARIDIDEGNYTLFSTMKLN